MSLHLRIQIDQCKEDDQKISVKSLTEAISIAQQEYEGYLAANGEPLNDKFDWDGLGVYEIGGRRYSVEAFQILVDYDITFEKGIGTINFCGLFESMEVFEKFAMDSYNFSCAPESYKVNSAKMVEGMYVKKKGWSNGVFETMKVLGEIRGNREKQMGELVDRMRKLLDSTLSEKLSHRIIKMVLEQVSHAELGLSAEFEIKVMGEFLDTILDSVRAEVHLDYQTAVSNVLKSSKR